MSATLLNRGQARGEFYKGIEFARELTGIAGLSIDVSSLNAEERYAFLASAAKFRKQVGPIGLKNLIGKKIDVENEKYSAGQSIGRTEMERDQTGAVQRRMGELAVRAAQLEVQLISDLILDGGTDLGYDGVSFFNNSHVYGNSGTQSNALDAAEIPALNIATAGSPTAEEAVDMVMGVIGYMLGYKDDEGVPMNETAREFGVVMPTTGTMWAAMKTSVLANNLAGGETNTLVALNGDGFSITAHANARLNSAPNVFYVFRKDGSGAKPFIYQEEMPYELSFLDENSDHFKLNDEYAAIAKWRGGVAYGEPLTAAQCTTS